MEDKDLRKKKLKYFLGGVGIATVVLLGYRHYEMVLIGMGIDKIINNPELLAKFLEKSREIMMKQISG
jgi:hypothetical protein